MTSDDIDILRQVKATLQAVLLGTGTACERLRPELTALAAVFEGKPQLTNANVSVAVDRVNSVRREMESVADEEACGRLVQALWYVYEAAAES